MIEIISIKHTRYASQLDAFKENRILGKILITYTHNRKFRLIRIDTLENRKYIFPDGNYKLEYEYSPKFKKNLWELKGIKDRSEIKIHAGTHHKQSHGCILIGNYDLKRLHNTLLNNETYTIQTETK